MAQQAFARSLPGLLLSTGLQRLWCRIAALRNEKEVGDVDLQSRGKLVEKVDAWVKRAVLDTADVRAIDARIDLKVLLREPLSGSVMSQVPSDACTAIHGRDSTNLPPTKPSNVFDIFYMPNSFPSPTLSRGTMRISNFLGAAVVAVACILPSLAQAQITDEMRIGSWVLVPYEGLGPGSCLLLTHSPDKDALIAFVDDEEETQFGFLSFTKDLSGPNRAAMDLRLDGEAAPLSGIRPFEESLVLFRQPADAERLDDLLIIADKVEVRGRDFVAEFKPHRTLAALTELWQCFGTQGEVHGDIDALEAEIRARSKQAGTSASAGAEAGAEANEIVGAGSAPGGGGTSSSELDAAIGGMTAAGAMVAQFACELSGPALTGVPDIFNKNQTSEMMLSIAEDGSATINGTQVTAASLRHNADGSLLMAAYDGRMVVSAVHGTPGSAAPVLGLSDEQVEAYQFGQQFALNLLGNAMADRNRFMLANLDQDTVTFFDLDANNQATNQQTPLCIRTR